MLFNVKYLKKCMNKTWRCANFICTKIVNFFSKFNFPLTKNNYKILRLKNKYKGERCFIIGNGPSLKVEDLDRLKDEITFASNKIYKIFDRTVWRPTFYMCVDELTLDQNKEEINSVEAKYKFGLKCYKHLLRADLYFNNNINKSKLGTFSKNAMESLYSSGTVSYHLLQIAYYMGFSEVYLLGIDYNYKGAISKTMDLSELKTERNCRLYFNENYVKSGEKRATEAPEQMYTGYENARLAYINSDRKIYNVTRTTYLDVFELKNFDEVVDLK